MLSSPKYVIEEFLEGPSLAAVYLCHGKSVRCLGVTEQLIGTPFLHAPSEFSYCGSIGPYQFADPGMENELDRIGRMLIVIDRKLQGLFGVDMILHEEQLYLLEVNPRYTASIEVLELTTSRNTLDLHAQAFGQRSRTFRRDAQNRMVGKAIYFAPNQFTFPQAGPWTTPHTDLWSLPQFADIPAYGTVIEQGHPVLTLFAKGNNEEAVQSELRLRTTLLDEMLKG